ncbi:hypothetical protein L2E82_43112 [Cichorium intybus]|uniref:Uncharacterized protein n=1 Tax=Cichorium intybus TaxID=13427 RepID=A0ACB8ZP42_CICIN|nr:hypothetical protein L2E82_43112 [Cichorium intybus]
MIETRFETRLRLRLPLAHSESSSGFIRVLDLSQIIIGSRASRVSRKTNLNVKKGCLLKIRGSWQYMKQVRDMLDNEENNQNAGFHVKEVQYIQAEEKIIKCVVDNIAVNIAFNKFGGLCNLCFLEEADILINQNGLFKRSIILIKAWCYYESSLGGHDSISAYALGILVVYIFHLYNNHFAGPLEVV